MSIHRDKERGQFVFTFDRTIAGAGRIRTAKRLPKTWNQAQADAYDRKATADLYARATIDLETRHELIDDAVALYITHRLPQLKHGRDVALELAQILPYYTGRPLSALADVCVAVKARNVREDGTPLAPATIRNRLAYLRAAVNYAWKEHRFGGEHKPTQRMSVPKVSNASDVFATRADMLRIALATQNRRVRAMLRRLYYSGKRYTEAAQAIVNPEGTAYHIPDTKNATPDWQPIHPKARTAFKVQPPSYTEANYWFAKAKKALGLQHLTLHKLRHGTATAIIEGGGTLDDVRAVLNHKSHASAMRYAHRVLAVKERALGFIGKKAA